MYMRSKLYQSTLVTSATFNTDPPFIFAAAKAGSLTILCNNWGNIDNTLIADVYWGEKTVGILPNVAAMTWVKDTGLTTTVAATAGTTTKVLGFLAIPQMKSKYMRVGFTLAGVGKTVDPLVWFNWTN